MPATCATGKALHPLWNNCDDDCNPTCSTDCFTTTSNVQNSVNTYCRTCAPTFSISTELGGMMGEPVEILPTGAVICNQNICRSSPYQRLAGDNCYCSPDKTISPTLCDYKRSCSSTQYLTFLNECKTKPEFCSEVVDGLGKCKTCTSPKVLNNAGECKDCTIKI